MSEFLTIPNERLYVGITVVFFFCGVLNLLLKTGLQNKMLIAFIRSVSQLFLLGLIISYIFQLPASNLIFPVAIMIMLASFKDGSLRRMNGVFQRYFAIFFSAVPMGLFTLFVIGKSSFDQPEIIIPIFGMLIGNSLNGVALGIERFEREIRAHRDLFISDLSLGLTPLYAAKKYIQLSLRASMTPILNAMSIVGIVSIPGMMTGQILAGASPVAASKYQLLILVSIMATIFIGAILGIMWSLKTLIRNDSIFFVKS